MNDINPKIESTSYDMALSREELERRIQSTVGGAQSITQIAGKLSIPGTARESVPSNEREEIQGYNSGQYWRTQNTEMNLTSDPSQSPVQLSQQLSQLSNKLKPR